MNRQNCAKVIYQTAVAWVISICFLSGTALATVVPVAAGDKLPRLSQVRMPTFVWAKPNCSPRAIIVGFHGGCLHGRSFDTLATKLAKTDLMFVSFDMRGFGKWHHCAFGSAQDRTFNYKHTFADVRVLLTDLRCNYPGAPIYFLGESLGANAAMVVAKEMPELTEGVILVSPAFGAKYFVSPQMMLDIARAITAPLTPLDMSPYLKKRLASNPCVVLEHLKDPLRRDLQTPKELWQSFTINYRGRKYAQKLCPNLALLVIHGKEDKLCSAKATAQAFQDIPNGDKQLVLVENSGHLIVESSLVKDCVVATIAGWINREVGMRAQLQQNRRLLRQTANRAVRSPHL